MCELNDLRLGERRNVGIDRADHPFGNVMVFVAGVLDEPFRHVGATLPVSHQQNSVGIADFGCDIVEILGVVGVGVVHVVGLTRAHMVM